MVKLTQRLLDRVVSARVDAPQPRLTVLEVHSQAPDVCAIANALLRRGASGAVSAGHQVVWLTHLPTGSAAAPPEVSAVHRIGASSMASVVPSTTGVLYVQALHWLLAVGNESVVQCIQALVAATAPVVAVVAVDAVTRVSLAAIRRAAEVRILVSDTPGSDSYLATTLRYRASGKLVRHQDGLAWSRRAPNHVDVCAVPAAGAVRAAVAQMTVSGSGQFDAPLTQSQQAMKDAMVLPYEEVHRSKPGVVDTAGQFALQYDADNFLDDDEEWDDDDDDDDDTSEGSGGVGATASIVQL